VAHAVVDRHGGDGQAEQNTGNVLGCHPGSGAPATTV